MRKLVAFLSATLLIFSASAQPGGYTAGTWANWSYNGRAHGYFKAVGWNKSVDHTLVFFGGDGQNPATFSTLDDVAPGSLITGSVGWNGITNLPGGGNVKWQIIVIGNSGTQPTLYATDIDYFFANTGFATGDTADHSKFHIGGLSGGPGRFWDYMKTTGNAYVKVFSTTMSLSCASLFDDYTTPALGKKHYVWYGDPAGDGNGGTTFFTSTLLYNGLPGTPNVDKRFKWTVGGGHNDGTWGNSSVNSCLNVVGTDSVTNRWIWMAQAVASGGGSNTPPTANAGSDKTITLPTSSVTLAGSGNDADGTIAGYGWSKISGSGGTITSPSASTTTITGLSQGAYVFRLTVVDDGGSTASDDVTVTVNPSQASTTLLTIIPGRDMYNIAGKKSPQLLFDGSVAEGNKIDQEFNINNGFSTPFRFFLVLGDSCYNHMGIDYYHGYGTSSWTINLYDSTKTLRGAYTFGGVFQNWATVQGNIDTISKPIRFIEFIATDPSTDVRELKIYGDRVAKCSDIAPTQAPSVFPDPGYKFQGGSSIGGSDTLYMQTQSGLPLYGSYRGPSNMFVWAHDETKAFDQQPIELDKYGDYKKSTLRFHKRMHTDMMLYINGANIKVRPDLNSNAGYNALTATNSYKDIPLGSDSTDKAQWGKNTGRVFKALTHIWGNNPASALGSSYNVFGTTSPDVSVAQNMINVMEIGNEDDKTWMGVTGFHSPTVLMAKIKTVYDSIKSSDPTMKVYLGALLSADTVQWKALYFLNYWLYPGQPFPCDGFCFNQYISNTYGGQPQGAGADAVSPEQFQITEKIKAYKTFRDRFFPGRGMRWTEIGYAVGNSDYDVKPVTGFADSVVQGNFMIRTLERAACVQNGLETVYNYFHTSDGSGVFAAMYMVVPKFDAETFAYVGSSKRPIWYMYATRMNVLYNYKGWSTLLTDGDSTNVSVMRYDHKTDPTKKVYYLVKGSYNGSTVSNYVLNVGNASQVTAVTMAYNDEDGVQTTLPVTGGNVTIPVVNEGPMYLIVQLQNTATNIIRRHRGTRFNIIPD